MAGVLLAAMLPLSSAGAAPEIMRTEGVPGSPGWMSTTGIRAVAIEAHAPVAGSSATSGASDGCCPSRPEGVGASIVSLLERVPDSADLIERGADVARVVVKVLRAVTETWLNRSDGSPELNEETARC